jgi:hypothetical protein
MRTEEDQSRFVPLKGYQNPDELRDKGRHWQQIIMFFVRTQQTHTWKSPKYRFNHRQQVAFAQLQQEVVEEVERRKQQQRQHHEKEEQLLLLYYRQKLPQPFCIFANIG